MKKLFLFTLFSASLSLFAATAPTITVTAAPTSGVSPLVTGLAPLNVSLAAACPSCVTYSWDFGDGTSQTGPTQAHVYQNAGTYLAVVKGADAAGNAASSYAIVAASPDLDNAYCLNGVPVGGSDETAILPSACINSSLAYTPSPGAVVPLAAGGSLQAAYNALQCGQTLSLSPGATYKTVWGTTFAAKNCDAQHWITITTGGAQLPPPGTRIDPSYLPQLAIILPVGGGEAIKAPADHIVFRGIAFMKPVGSGVLQDFLELNGANDIVIDRVYMHGNPKEEMVRGVALGAASRIAVIDSWIDEQHCIAGTGSCTDAQAIAGGGGSVPSSTVKIVNDYLQASGENIMFGGLAALYPTTDVEIRRNHLDKPLAWRDTTVMGTTKYIVKNDLEFKNIVRVLVEGNVLTGSWGGYTQTGFGIVISPKNQAGANGTNICPTCLVTDVTIRYNTISHVGGGFQIANALSDNKGAAVDGERYSIHDIVIDDIDPVKYDGSGLLAQISTGAGAPLLQNVSLEHITAFPKTLAIVGDFVAVSGQMRNFVFANNIAIAGVYPVWSTGGGSTNCAYYDVPLTTFNACFDPTSVFSSNVIAGATSNYPPSKWPAGNLFPATVAAIQFVNYDNGNGGDYHLTATSPYKGLASDGRDPGADIDLVKEYTRAVN